LNEVTRTRKVYDLGQYEQIRSVQGAERLILFVHGFGGNYQRTWGSLPDYLAADPRFQDANIYLFGFRTGLLRYFAAPIAALAQRLKTILLFEQAGYGAVTAIAHSMGGLVLKEAVASALLTGDSNRLKPLRHVVFCSTPHLGEVKATALAAMGTHFAELRALRSQLIETHGVWQTRVRHVAGADDDIVHERYTARMRVTNVWALSDWIVSRANASALTSDRDVVTVAGSHTSMVKPVNSEDNVYLTISQLLETDEGYPNRASPSERMMTTSLTLTDPTLHISDTQSIPDKYQSLCRRLYR
jgi:pimeloyl-ACP methyl ester carboxylesterase